MILRLHKYILSGDMSHMIIMQNANFTCKQILSYFSGMAKRRGRYVH